MKCIYCRKPSTSAQGIAHVFPEAIVKNNIVLPKGSVCDSCNNYLKELDSALIAHNHIWPIIQMAGLPGKKGKPRKKLGYIERSDKDQSLLLNFNQKSIEKITVSEKQIHLQIKNPQNFEDKLFRRALHHVGFNFFALSRQNDSLLAAHFDNIRRYIRQPHKDERWSYAQRFPSQMHNVFDAEEVANAPGIIIRISIFNDDFFIDMLNTGQLNNWALTVLPTGTLLH